MRMPPISSLGATCSGRIARSATPMTVAGGRGSAAANTRMRRRFASPSVRCRTARCSITSATASGTRGCRPGTCPTGRSGNSSPISVTCRTRREWLPRSLRRATAMGRLLPRPTSARPRARNATRKSTGAGANREWRTWCAIRASIPTRSFPISPSPIRSLTFTKDDIAFVYGSRWKQRYFTKIGDDYFPEPAQWDVTHKMWKQLFRRATAPTGGRRFIRRTISSGRPARYATAAIRSTTTLRPRK